jgi:uncharacterized SAM-binding protein YcdF (DUF218 family)
LVIAALLVIWLGGNRWVALVTARSLEWQTPPLAEDSLGDVIVVLGGATRESSPPRSSSELNEAGDRLVYALRLWQEGVAEKILVTGGGASWVGPSNIPEGVAMAETLMTMGVPKDAILIEPNSRNTYENAIETRALMEKEGLERAVLVTSAMHMPRSLAIFRRQGVDVTAAPTDYWVSEADCEYYLAPNLGVQLINLIPSAQDMNLTSMALKEWIGLLVYRLRGWA